MDLKPLMQLSYGMYVVGADDNGKPAGCIVNTISQITSENPIVALSMNKNNYTHDVILNSGKFSVSILSEQTDPTVISYMGFSSGRDTNKFEQVAYRMVEDMPVLTDHISGAFLCKVVGSYEVETHTIILGRVVDTFDYNDDIPPMSYRYYHHVVKGKAPKNAPTYVKEEVTAEQPEEEIYVCTVCGYVYHGDLTKEPDDYVCPICKQGKDKFVKK